jgi:hypothetical protein
MLTDAMPAPAAASPRRGFDVPQPIRACCADLRLRPDDLILHLHQEILEAMPTATGRLARNGRPLCRRLALAVLDAATPGQPPGAAEAMLRQVGADNHDEGFPSDRYASIVHALLRAVRSSYHGEWTTALSSGCVEYFIWVRDQLTEGASVARQQPGRTLRPQPPAPAPSPSPAGSAGDDLDEEDGQDSDSGYGELMVAMTLNSRRERRHRSS